MINEQGGEAIFMRCDVSKVSEIENMIRVTVDTYHRLDYAFNNAGIEGEQAMTADSTEDNWNRVININLRSVWACMKYEISQMLEQGKGAIVNCSSIAGLVGYPTVPAYTASKHGIIGLTKAAALEYAQQSIRVNAVCPGVIQTSMIERFTQGDSEVQAQLVAGEPIGRIGQPEEIADAVIFLCSDKASFMTGHAMAIDGGWIAQ